MKKIVLTFIILLTVSISYSQKKYIIDIKEYDSPTLGGVWLEDKVYQISFDYVNFMDEKKSAILIKKANQVRVFIITETKETTLLVNTVKCIYYFEKSLADPDNFDLKLEPEYTISWGIDNTDKSFLTLYYPDGEMYETFYY